jgi:hypothetical protein
LNHRIRAILSIIFIFALPILACGSLPTVGNPSRNCPDLPQNNLPGGQGPAGTTMHRSNVVGNDEEAIEFDTLVTTDSVGALIDHYNKQTGNVIGWSLLKTEKLEDVAWSSWTYTDHCGDVWDGLIVISQEPPTSQPFMTMRLSKPKKP